MGYHHKRSTVIVLFVLLAVIAQACARQTPQTSDLPDLGAITIGYLPTTGFAPFFVAQEKGYFKELGLDVQLERFDSGSKMIAPLSAGQLDVGGGEPGTALFNASYQKLDVKAVCGFASQAPGYGGVPILVRKDLYDSGEVTGPADLKGKKIGVNVTRGMVEYTVYEALKQGELTLADVDLIEMPFPDMAAAFSNGAIDAANVPYPTAGRIIKDGSAVILLGGDEIAGEIQNGIIYFGKRLLDPANKEVSIRILMAYMRAVRELEGDNWKKDENLNIIAEFTKLPVDTIRNSVRSYYDPSCEFVEESLEKVQAYYVSKGYTEFKDPLPLTQVINVSFAEEAVKRIGAAK